MKTLKKTLGAVLLSLLLTVTAFGGDMLGGVVGDPPPPPPDQQQLANTEPDAASQDGAPVADNPVAETVLDILQAVLSLF